MVKRSGTTGPPTPTKRCAPAGRASRGNSSPPPACTTRPPSHCFLHGARPPVCQQIGKSENDDASPWPRGSAGFAALASLRDAIGFRICGIRWFRCAAPPANCFDPSGIVVAITIPRRAAFTPLQRPHVSPRPNAPGALHAEAALMPRACSVVGLRGARPSGDWTFFADVRWDPEPQRRTPERCLGQAGCWPAAASGNTPRGHLRLRFVPEARKKLAGGGAQRNHRINRPEERCAPAGRESRGTPPTRLALATLHHGRTSRTAGNPVGVRRPGAERGRVRRGGERCRRAFTALAPRRGTRLGWGGGSGGSAALHHRLISYVPPARRGREAGNAAGTERKCPNSRGPRCARP